MEIKFTTAAAMDFTNVWYVIALNTDGTGRQPYPINGNQQQNWLGYSFEIIVSQLPTQTGPQASLIQFLTQPAAGGGTVKVPSQPFVLTPQQLQLQTSCNGNPNQLCVIIQRSVFTGLVPPSSSPSPSPSASASPSPSPSPSPSGSPSASASPSASPSPPVVGGIWNINWFTVAANASGLGANGQVIDAPGTLGVNDTTWLPPNGTYDTTTSFDYLWNASPAWPQVANADAQIAGGEVLNTP